ncbi:Zinc finger protein [Nymphon striatum]|nr:Zinc finger protein [Nymphon striatum]
MDLVKWSRITIKKEPEFDIEQNNSIIDSSPPGWLSVEIKNIKEENEDSLSSVYDDNADYLQEKRCKEQYEVLNQETSKNIMNSTFSKTFGANTDDGNENSPKTICSLEMDENEVTDMKAYECNVCHKSFTHESHLKNHTRTPLECVECQKCFYHSSILKRHLLKKSLECNICHKCFTHKSSVKEHMYIHSNEKNFACDICDKSFISSDRLKRHKRMHSDEKSFKCDICSKGFKESSKLRRHLLTHSKKNSFQCNVCHKVYTREICFENHM